MKGIPVFLNLENKKVIVIGGGSVGYRKIITLINEGIRPLVISPELCPELEEYMLDFDYLKKEFSMEDAYEVDVAFIATNSSQSNSQINEFLKETNITVSMCENPDEGDFYSMAYSKFDDVIYSLSTGGEVPFLTKKLKEEFEIIVRNVLNERTISDMGKLRRKLISENKREEISQILEMDKDEIKRMINDED